jgi:hypothetical protein
MLPSFNKVIRICLGIVPCNVKNYMEMGEKSIA